MPPRQGGQEKDKPVKTGHRFCLPVCRDGKEGVHGGKGLLSQKNSEKFSGERRHPCLMLYAVGNSAVEPDTYG